MEKEALESVMCDVIIIRLKRREATRSKINFKLHLKFDNPGFKKGRSIAILIFRSWFPFPLLVAILLFRFIFYDVTHDTFQLVDYIEYGLFTFQNY